MQNVYQITENQKVFCVIVSSESDFQKMVSELSDRIISFYDEKCVDDFLRPCSDLFTEKEQMFVKCECLKQFKNHYHDLHAILAEDLSLYLAGEQHINLEGFFRFRATKYREELLHITDAVIEEYLLESEYHQFIESLSCFLDLQPSLIPTINLIQDGTDYLITDENHQTILMLSKYDEPLLDMIITLAPQEINIKRPETFYNQSLIQTVIELFKDKIHIIP